jgi:hypothetical protein
MAGKGNSVVMGSNPESNPFVGKIYVLSEVNPSRRVILNFYLLFRV